MQVHLFDEVVLDAGSLRRTADGYLAAVARSARTGIQEYRAGELGLTDRAPTEIVRVYRPAEEVFAADAMKSMAFRPVTMDHPPEPVTAKNWKRLSVGNVGGEVIRDGEFVSVPLVLMDADAISDVEGGKKQLSWGYSCELVLGDGTTPEGEKYDAVQKGIRANHLAVCSAARGGPALRIGDDDRRTTAEPKDGEVRMPHTLIIDGLQVVDVSDSAKAAIEKLQGQLGDANTARAAAETQVATLTTDKATLEAKVVTLEQKVADAVLTPAQLRDAAKAYAATADKAKALGVAVTDSMDEAAIQRAVVDAKIGAAAKDWTDAQVAASFATLTAGTGSVADAARHAIASGVVNLGDAAKAVADAKAARLERLGTGYQRVGDAA